jgi:hypothetical protein
LVSVGSPRSKGSRLSSLGTNSTWSPRNILML